MPLRHHAGRVGIGGVENRLEVGAVAQERRDEAVDRLDGFRTVGGDGEALRVGQHVAGIVARRWGQGQPGAGTA